MAIFNPDVPNAEIPFYGKLSQPISSFDLKSAAGIAFKEGGELVSGAVKGADTVVKAFISDEVEGKVRPLREDYMDTLSKAKQQVAGTLTPGVATDASPVLNEVSPLDSQATVEQSNKPTPASLDLTPKELPQDLKNLPRTLNTLDSARANGKLSETDYYGRLVSLVKDVRSKYPVGYYKYVDNEVKEITGVDPANAYIHSIIGDINSYVTSAQAEKNHLLRFIESHIGKVEGAEFAYQAVQSGKWKGADVMRWAEPAMRDINRVTQMRAKLDLEKDYEGFTNRDWTKMADLTFSAKSDQFYNKLTLPDVKPNEDGNIILNPAQQKFFSDSIQQQKLAYIRWAEAESIKPVGESGRTIVSQLGSKTVGDMIAANAKNFDTLSDYVNNDKTGTIHQALHLGKAIKERDDLSLLTEYGGYSWAIRKVGSVDRLGGSEASKQIMKEFYLGQMPELSRQFIAAQKLEMLDPNPLKPKTFTDHINDAQKAGITLPQHYEELFKMVYGSQPGSFLSDKTTDYHKTTIMNALVNPKNADMIKRIAPDYYDAQGNHRPGLYSILRDLTSPEVTAEVVRLSVKGNSKLFTDYKNWVEGSNRQLFINDIKDLDTRIPSLPPGATLNWNDTTNQLSLSYKGRTDYNNTPGLQQKTNAPRTTTDELNAVLISGSINRLNLGLGNLGTLAKAANQDASSYLLTWMQSEGMNLFNENVRGIPENIWEAIVAKKTAEEREKAALEAKKKALRN